MTELPASPTLRRARPLLGTLVSLQLDDPTKDSQALLQASEAAFDAIAQIHSCMSAHAAGSDLARLARARAGERVPVNPHTAAVLRLAQTWFATSAGAFDPHGAGRRLAQLGVRPGLGDAQRSTGSLLCLRVRDDRFVDTDGPLQLDLGGIAK